MVFLFLKAALVILICIILLWILSVYLKNASIVDIFWGSGFVIVNAVYFFYQDIVYTRHIILIGLVTLWGFHSLFISERYFETTVILVLISFSNNYVGTILGAK